MLCAAAIASNLVVPGDAATHSEQHSIALVIGGGVPLVLALLAIAISVALRGRARKVRSLVALRAGDVQGDVVVEGVVETDDKADPPIKVQRETRRASRETAGGKRFDTWIEVSRDQVTRPFDLRLADGNRVRVLPGSNVVVVDPKPTATAIDADRKRWTAQISAGEHVWIRGLARQPERDGAARAYRDGADEVALVPLADGEMYASATSPDVPVRKRARATALLAVACIALFAVIQTVVLGTWHALRRFGEVVELPVVATHTWQERVHRRSEPERLLTHFQVESRYDAPDGSSYRYEVEVHEYAYRRLREPDARVPFMVWRRFPRVGRAGDMPYMTATEFGLAWWLPTVASLMYAATLAFALRRDDEWHSSELR